MSFKDIFIYISGSHFCSAEPNHLSIFGSVHYEKHISYLKLLPPFVQQSRTDCAILVGAILVEGIMRNISDFFLIWTSASGDVV